MYWKYIHLSISFVTNAFAEMRYIYHIGTINLPARPKGYIFLWNSPDDKLRLRRPTRIRRPIRIRARNAGRRGNVSLKDEWD